MKANATNYQRSIFGSLLSMIGWCGLLGAIGFCTLGLSNFVVPEFWVADNMSFFLRQFLGAGLAGCLGGVIGLGVRHRIPGIYKGLLWLALIAWVALAGLTIYRTVTNTKPQLDLVTGQGRLKVVSINMEGHFPGDARLRAFLEEAKPDIVVLQEAEWWLQRRRWQQLGTPNDGAGTGGLPGYLTVGQLEGLVVYSRVPARDHKSIVVAGEPKDHRDGQYDPDREILSLDFVIGDWPFKLIAVHPDSPRDKTRWLNKQVYFDRLDEHLQALDPSAGKDLMLIGDWNSSPWSNRFQQTLSKHHLSTAYPDGFPQTTRFFFDYRLHWFLGAPVDQFAVSESVKIADVALGPDIGSDHLPLVVEIGLDDLDK